MVEGDGTDGIVETEELHGHQIAVGAEGVVGGAHKAVDADAFAGVGDAGGLAHAWHTPHVKVRRAAAKRLLPQQIVAE